MSETMQKFKDMVESAQTVAIKTGATNDIAKILTAAVLYQTIQKTEKKIVADLDRANQNIKNFLSAILETSPEHFSNVFEQPENILIKFDTNKLPISQLRYEKNGDELKIILESKEKSLDTSIISINKEKVPVDLLILIDPAQNALDVLISETPHKDVIKIGIKDGGLASKISEIVKIFWGGHTVPVNFKEALWFLGEELENSQRRFSKEYLSFFSELAELNIDREKLQKAKEILLGKNFWKLFGRALARSHYEDEFGVFWSFLTKNDFEKTDQSSRSVLHILNHIKILRAENKFISMLWEEEPKKINAVISAENPLKLESLALEFSAAPASSYFFVNGFGNFSEAEIQIRNAIKKIA